jgi:hypothetical protein
MPKTLDTTSGDDIEFTLTSTIYRESGREHATFAGFTNATAAGATAARFLEGADFDACLIVITKHRAAQARLAWRLSQLAKQPMMPTEGTHAAMAGWECWWNAWQTPAREPHKTTFREAYLNGFLTGYDSKRKAPFA